MNGEELKKAVGGRAVSDINIVHDIKCPNCLGMTKGFSKVIHTVLNEKDIPTMKMTGKFFEYMGPYGQTYRCPKCGYEYRYYINTEVLDEFK